jgi:hypothetical protein
MLWRLILLSFLTGLGVSLGLGAAVTAIAGSRAVNTGGQTIESPVDGQGVALARRENPQLIKTALPRH